MYLWLYESAFCVFLSIFLSQQSFQKPSCWVPCVMFLNVSQKMKRRSAVCFPEKVRKKGADSEVTGSALCFLGKGWVRLAGWERGKEMFRSQVAKARVELDFKWGRKRVWAHSLAKLWARASSPNSMVTFSMLRKRKRRNARLCLI